MGKNNHLPANNLLASGRISKRPQTGSLRIRRHSTRCSSQRRATTRKKCSAGTPGSSPVSPKRCLEGKKGREYRKRKERNVVVRNRGMNHEQLPGLCFRQFDGRQGGEVCRRRMQRTAVVKNAGVLHDDCQIGGIDCRIHDLIDASLDGCRANTFGCIPFFCSEGAQRTRPSGSAWFD